MAPERTSFPLPASRFLHLPTINVGTFFREDSGPPTPMPEVYDANFNPDFRLTHYFEPVVGYRQSRQSYRQSWRESSGLSGSDWSNFLEQQKSKRDSNLFSEKSGDGGVLVSWNGDSDPQNPLNWTKRRKWTNIAVISAVSTVTPLAAAILAPSTTQFLAEWQSSDMTMGALAVSIYTLGFAVGPLLLSPLSEEYGRLVVYHSCGVLFIIFSVACALSTSLNMLIGMRFLAGCAGSAPISLGGGSIADMMPPEQRGAAMSIQALGGMLGPAIGPVIGSFLSQTEGWRWVLWLVAIIGGATTVTAIVVLRETYAPVLLARKAARLRKETGSESLTWTLAPPLPPLRKIAIACARPCKMLLFSPIALVFSLLMGVAYGVMYLLYTVLATVFEQQYGFSIGISGLTYLGAGIGTFIGLGIIMYWSDKVAIRLARSNNGVILPEMRLPMLVWGYMLFPIGFLIYGWTAEERVHWIAPIIGNAVTGVGVMFVYLPVQIYLVDCYPQYAASALAAVCFFRSVLGAFLPLAGTALDDNLGIGVGNTVLAAIGAAFWPVGIFTYIWGRRLRERFPLNL